MDFGLLYIEGLHLVFQPDVLLFLFAGVLLGISIAWLSLDQADNDPVRFWNYLITAIRTLHPDAGEMALSRLRSPEPHSNESVLTSLINDLSDCTDNCTVILDDYHLIKAESIHTGITFLLDHLPPRTHLVISTRTAPPPWARASS